MKQELNLYDIVIVGKVPVQIVGFVFTNTVTVQDIHTKTAHTFPSLISKASKNEVKWFCERTEHINFIKPRTQGVR